MDVLINALKLISIDITNLKLNFWSLRSAFDNRANVQIITSIFIGLLICWQTLVLIMLFFYVLVSLHPFASHFFFFGLCFFNNENLNMNVILLNESQKRIALFRWKCLYERRWNLTMFSKSQQSCAFATNITASW